jgi:hypothetical protein
MLERDVIGNKEWTRGFLCDIDVSYLEAFDSEMRSRTHSVQTVKLAGIF